MNISYLRELYFFKVVIEHTNTLKKLNQFVFVSFNS